MIISTYVGIVTLAFPTTKLLNLKMLNLNSQKEILTVYVVKFHLLTPEISNFTKEQDLEFSGIFLKLSQTENPLTYLFAQSVEKLNFLHPWFKEFLLNNQT